MKINLTCTLLLLSLGLSAQNDKGKSYYYGGKKIFLQESNSRIVFQLKPGEKLEQHISMLTSLLNVPVKNIETGNGSRVSIHIPDQFASKIDGILHILNAQSYIQFAHPCFKSKAGKDIGWYDEIIVKVKTSTTYSQMVSLLQKEKCSLVKTYLHAKQIFLVSAGEENNYDPVLTSNRLFESGLFEYAEPNFSLFNGLDADPDDFFYNLQWAHKNTGSLVQYNGVPGADMNVPAAWAIATGTGINVAIIDNGIELTHPDLQSNMLQGYDCTTGSSAVGAGSPLSTNGHGTNCAGIIGAVSNNSIGVAGVSPTCKIIPVNIVDSSGVFASYFDIAAGFDFAWQNGADILSNSWGGGLPSNTLDDAINRAITMGRNNKGCLVLFSSGNNTVSGSNNDINYPSTNQNVISVGGVNMFNEHKTFTSQDNEAFWSARSGTGLDVSAPCVKITSTDMTSSGGYNMILGTPGDYNNEFRGTSSACANTAGVAALILSANPGLTGIQARTILESNCNKLPGYAYATAVDQPNGSWNDETGYGSVNAFKAVTVAGTPDLKIVDPQVARVTVARGDTVSCSFIEENAGYMNASANHIRFYLSADTILSPGQNGDIYLDEYFLNLAPDAFTQSIVLDTLLTIPANTPTGNYYVFFSADDAQVITESDELNNLARVEISIVDSTDLIISYLTHDPIVIIPGNTAQVHYTAQNTGTSNAAANTIALYISSDNVLDTLEDQQLNVVTQTALESGVSNNDSLTFSIPGCFACGNYYVFLFIDHADSITEIDNNNNTTSFMIEVGGPVANISPTGNVSLCEGQTQTLTADACPANSYQWFFNDIEVTGATDSAYVASERGKYTVRVSAAGCESFSDPVFLGPIITYTFTGAGNWNDAANWLDNNMPPSPLPACYEIVVDPLPGEECLLNVEQIISAGAKLTVMPLKTFVIQGQLYFY
jgi:subtilisin family serine protease